MGTDVGTSEKGRRKEGEKEKSSVVNGVIHVVILIRGVVRCSVVVTIVTMHMQNNSVGGPAARAPPLRAADRGGGSRTPSPLTGRGRRSRGGTGRVLRRRVERAAAGAAPLRAAYRGRGPRAPCCPTGRGRRRGEARGPTRRCPEWEAVDQVRNAKGDEVVITCKGMEWIRGQVEMVLRVVRASFGSSVRFLIAKNVHVGRDLMKENGNVSVNSCK